MTFFVKSILILFTVLVVIATVLPLFRITHWVVRGWDFPRLQIASVAAILLIFSIYFADFNDPLSWGLIIVLGLCIMHQLRWILPYTPLWSKEVESADESSEGCALSLITANVLMTNKDSERLIEVVKEYKPDMLVTLETNKWWEDKLSVLEDEMPHTVKYPLENLYGMHLYSRIPLHETELKFLVEEDVPSIHTCIRLNDRIAVRMHFLHPAPPSPTENEESEERDAELVMVAKSVAESDQPLVVTGDLNDVAWSRTTRLFRKLSGMLDPRVGRGMFNTFHAGYFLLRWPLDHIFISSHFRLCRIKRLPSIGSDHFPLYTQISYRSEDQNEENGLKPDEEDEKLAKEMEKEEDVREEEVPRPNE